MPDYRIKLNNVYYLARHGEAYSNGHRFYSSWPEKKVSYLMPEGEKQIKQNTQFFKKAGLDLIFASDLARTKSTAEIISKATGVSVKFDKRLREMDFGIFNGKPIEEYDNYFKNNLEKFRKNPPKGENFKEIQERMIDFLKEINKKYKNKKVLIVSHGGPLFLLESWLKGLNQKQTILAKRQMIKTGEFRKL